MRACLVVNPRSAAGATGRRLPEVEAAARRFFDGVEVRRTQRSGHAAELAAEAVAEGFDRIVAVGGDGTANEVVNGLFDLETGLPRRDDVVFSVIPAGTGSDLVKTLKMPRELDRAFELLATCEPRPCDVLRVDMTGHDGAPLRRMGINVTGFGLSGVVVERANRSSKRLGGTITFLRATGRALLSWPDPPVGIRWWDHEDVEHSWEGRLNNAFLANGQFCGGGMWVGRGGSMHDGLIDFTIVPKLQTSRAILGGPRLFTGTMDRVAGVKRVLAKRVQAQPIDATPILIDIDGEQPGSLPINVEVVPKSLLIAAKWA